MSKAVSGYPFTYEYYEWMLSIALDRGYRFIPFSSAREMAEGGGYSCCLRHDCDNDMVAAAELARIEKNLGIRSTYFVMLRSGMYNLFADGNFRLVKEIMKCGHWLGLHFDESFYDVGDNPSLMAAHVDRERQILSSQFDTDIDVVSFHQPSVKVLNGEWRINCISTYSREDMAGFHYISDSNMVWREACPSVLFSERRYPLLHLLLHPEWWTARPMPTQQKWHTMFSNNFDLVQRTMLAKERAYNTRQKILLVPAEEE